MTQTAPAQKSCKPPCLNITHIMHMWRGHEQRIGRHPQEHTIVFLVPSTDKWPCHMEAPLVCTIHGANLIINITPLAPFRPFAIPNENIRRCPRGQRTNPHDVAQAVNGNRNFVYAPGVFRIKQDITKDACYGRNGHAIHVVCHEIWKVWDVVPLRQSFRPSNFSDNTIQVSNLGGPQKKGNKIRSQNLR